MPENKEPYRVEITAELIEKYLKGQLDGKTMHAIERQALDDPFLAEALEGYSLRDHVQTDHLDDLHERVQSRIGRRGAKEQRIWVIRYRNAQIAAAAILLILVGIGVYFFAPKHTIEKPALAVDNTAILPQDSVDSVRAAPGAVAVNSRNRKDVTAHTAEKTRRQTSGKVAAENMNVPDSLGNDLDTMNALADNKVKQDQTAEPGGPPGNLLAARSAASNGLIRNTAPAPASANKDSLWIAGKITDANTGESIPGVSISIPGTRYATVSSLSGDFKMRLPADSGKIRFTGLGYDTRTITAFPGEENIAVSMHPNQTALNESVVVGYAKKSGRASYSKNRARPSGGLAAYKRYLRDSLHYPAEALADQVEGVVKLSFMVMPDSTLRQIEVLRSPGYGFGDEAIRLLKEGPAWYPVVRGDTCREEIEVKFNLRDARK